MAVPEDIQAKVLEEAYSATPNYDIDYNDPRFQQNQDTYQEGMDRYQQIYDKMTNESDDIYSNLIDKHGQWKEKQEEIQQANTDFAIEKIEQQKEQAQKDYVKEQSGAYVDWQKQSNQYGVEAEKMAAAGLMNSGYSESSQVSMYNQYQNRVALARESLEKANLNYNNAINEAILQNNAALAEIAATTYIKQAELALEGALYKNQLIVDLADKQTALEQDKWERDLAVINQQNFENEMAQKDRQAELDREHAEKLQLLDQDFEAKQAQIQRDFESKENDIKRKHEIELEGIRDKNEREQLKIKQQHALEQLEKEKQNELAKLDKELANAKALASYEASLKKQSIPVSGGSATVTNSKGTASGTPTNGASRTTVSKTVTSATPTGTPNMDSVLELGYGPISATQLAKLVASGEVVVTKKNGQLYYKRKAGYSTASPSQYLVSNTKPSKTQNAGYAGSTWKTYK